LPKHQAQTAPGPSRRPPRPVAKQRLIYLDNLKIFLIAVDMPCELKFLLVAPLGSVASFTLAYYLVKVPGAGKVL
jgi:hypothetical protein